MKKIVIFTVIFLLISLAPLQSISKTTSNQEIQTKNSEEEISSSFFDITKYLWKFNKNENAIFSSLLKNEDQDTKDIFNTIISDNKKEGEEEYPKVIDFVKTDQVINESNQEQDDYFESETWAWYKQRLGWILEASEVISNFFNETLDIICELRDLPEKYLTELQNTIDYLTSMIHYWKEGIFYLESLKISVLKEKFNMIKEELTKYINKIQENIDDLKEDWGEEKERVIDWFESEPWDCPIYIDCNIKDVKGSELEITWGRLFGLEKGSQIIPISGLDNDVHYQVMFDTSDLKEKGTQHLAQYCWVRVNKSDETFQIRYCWAFSNAQVKLDFFSDEDDSTRDFVPLFQKLIKRYPIFLRFLEKIGLINILIK